LTVSQAKTEKTSAAESTALYVTVAKISFPAYSTLVIPSGMVALQARTVRHTASNR